MIFRQLFLIDHYELAQCLLLYYVISIHSSEGKTSMSKNIMIVDDAAFMRATLKGVLTTNGYNVTAEAVDGNDAVTKYNTFKPDCVLMDITMPEMDGLAALEKIKAMDPNAKIIMCSAVGQQQNVMNAISIGAKDFVVKPFKPERVIESVKKVIGE